MKATIDRKALLQALELCNKVASHRNTFSILANVKLAAGDRCFTVETTDLENSISIRIDDYAATQYGDITVNCKQLFGSVKSDKSDILALETLKGERLEVTSKAASFTMPGMSTKEYPSLMAMHFFSPVMVETSRLHEGLEQVAFAMSDDETHYNINGVFLESVDNSTRFIATDGHRLALYNAELEGLRLEQNVIVARESVKLLLAALKKHQDGGTKIEVNEGFLTIAVGNTVISCRLIDGEFPDYRQLIPKTHNTEISLPRSVLLDAVNRVKQTATDKAQAVKCNINGALILSASNPDGGEASESLDIEHTGDNLTIGISGKYLSQALKSAKHALTAKLRYNGNLGPITVETEHYGTIHVIMPMRFD